ncbi:MAG: orotidine-5'-phosphate decarboxylase [Methylobacteriaceae bacterium]|nr:orotidine-5'-phosphate decarboxylase [Methylobacteriaceae bacterium]
MRPIPVSDRLIVALDAASIAEAKALVDRLGASVTFYKVGLELTCAGGLPLVEELVDKGKHVFLDLKLHDIPNTVERATSKVARLGVRFLTIHAYPQTMAAARRGAEGASLDLLAVTVLTSCDDADLAAAGYAFGTKALVSRRAAQAKAEGIAGIVLSPEEVSDVRVEVGPQMILVVPGIRQSGGAAGDQKRVMSARDTIRAGADHLVVGRPITRAPDPEVAAEAILAEIAAAQA